MMFGSLALSPIVIIMTALYVTLIFQNVYPMIPHRGYIGPTGHDVRLNIIMSKK